MSNLINRIVFSSEIWEEGNEINMTIVVIILLKLYLLYILYVAFLNLLLNLTEQINKHLFVLITWALLVLFALI